jgi:hypothetical protein
MYAHVRDVRLRVNWRRAATPPDPAAVLAALRHPSASVNWVGANLLENGAAGSDAERVTAEELRSTNQSTLNWITQAAIAILDPSVAAKLVADRLGETVEQPVIGILQGLQIIEPSLRALLLPALRDPLMRLTTHSVDVVSRVARETLVMFETTRV